MSITRRRFLGGTSSTLAGAAMLTSACATSSSFKTKPIAASTGRVIGANDRINLGIIGFGMRGPELLRRVKQIQRDNSENVTITAVCEIYERRKKMMMAQAELDSCYHNYEDMLADPNVDAVMIAVPDHWHMKMSIDAMNAGKDVYCEKPMTLYWDEAKKVVAAQEKTGRVFQVGAQSSSEAKWRVAREFLGDGKTGIAGKVLQFQTSYNRNVPGGDWNYTIFDDANAQTIDWPRWLGSAPSRPFNEEAIERFFRFRKYWDYSGGLATDLLYHKLAHISAALGYPSPKRVVAAGGNFIHFDREVPDTFTILADFDNECSGVLLATSGNDRNIEEQIQCEHATLTFTEDSVVAIPQRAYMDAVRERAKALEGVQIIEADEGGKTVVKEIRKKTERGEKHVDNFLACMRNRQQPVLNAEAGYRVMTTIALAIKSYRERTVCCFDPIKQEVVRA